MKKKIPDKKAKTHDELDDFTVGIDQFGRINTSIDIDKINAFLNKNVVDKKFTLPLAKFSVKDRQRDRPQRTKPAHGFIIFVRHGNPAVGKITARPLPHTLQMVEPLSSFPNESDEHELSALYRFN